MLRKTREKSPCVGLFTRVNLDPTMRNLAELRSWPEFHNGVAAGLRLAPVQDEKHQWNIQACHVIQNYVLLKSKTVQGH
ncbi:Anaphase-promoting complex subunit 1 [Nymphaea thermarum]|nr:Anaphase-promoting complex subunit 1 [Nymphaea thermarum]